MHTRQTALAFSSGSLKPTRHEKRTRFPRAGCADFLPPAEAGQPIRGPDGRIFFTSLDAK